MTEARTDSDQPADEPTIEMIKPEIAEQELRENVQKAREERIERDIPNLAAYFNDLFETAVDPLLWEPEPNAGWYRCSLTTFILHGRWSLDDHPESRFDDMGIPTWHFYIQAKLDLSHTNKPGPANPLHRISNRVELGAAIAKVDYARTNWPTRSGGNRIDIPFVHINPPL